MVNIFLSQHIIIQDTIGSSYLKTEDQTSRQKDFSFYLNVLSLLPIAGERKQQKGKEKPPWNAHRSDVSNLQEKQKQTGRTDPLLVKLLLSLGT